MSASDQLMELCVILIAFHGSDEKVYELIVIEMLICIENCEHNW